MKHKLIGVATVFAIAFIIDVPLGFLVADIAGLWIMLTNDNSQENWFRWLKNKMDRM